MTSHRSTLVLVLVSSIAVFQTGCRMTVIWLPAVPPCALGPGAPQGLPPTPKGDPGLVESPSAPVTTAPPPPATPPGTPLAGPVTANLTPGEQKSFSVHVPGFILRTGQPARIPVDVVAPERVQSFSFVLLYDSTKIRYTGMRTTPFGEGHTVTVEETSPGTLKIRLESSRGLQGEGSLAMLGFQIGNVTAEETTQLRIRDLTFTPAA